MHGRLGGAACLHACARARVASVALWLRPWLCCFSWCTASACSDPNDSKLVATHTGCMHHSVAIVVVRVSQPNHEPCTAAALPVCAGRDVLLVPNYMAVPVLVPSLTS